MNPYPSEYVAPGRVKELLKNLFLRPLLAREKN
jgi:hypothetical protein